MNLPDPIVDLHVHGLGDPSTAGNTPASYLELARRQRAGGTDYFLPTLFPDTIENMRAAMEAVSAAMVSPHENAGAILGVHLEGPFLNPEFCGALDPERFLTPSRDDFRRLTEGLEDVIKIITLSPELPGAPGLVEMAVQKGIVVSMGHSGATMAEALAAKKAGARGVTHLFNAMGAIHHREPGLAGLALTDPDLYVEVIADGHHLAPWTLDLIFRTKPAQRIIAISDSIACDTPAANAVRSADGRLLGGALPLPACADILKKTGIPEPSIHLALSENPLRYLGLFPP